METATTNQTNAHYNDEVLFFDGILEFHADIYSDLSPEDKELLKIYYLVGQEPPENIFEYRNALVQEHPDIEARAKAAFARVLEELGIHEFAYSTEYK